MEQRQHVRTNIEGITVYLGDKNGLCTATLKDISRFGVCIADIPRTLHVKNGCFDAVIHGEGVNFKLHLQEKWRSQQGDVIVVGAAIDSVPWDWAELTLRNELRLGLNRPNTSVRIHKSYQV